MEEITNYFEEILAAFNENGLVSWAMAVGITILTYGILKIVKRILLREMLRFAKKSQNDIDDIIVDVVEETKNLSLLVFSLYIGTLFLTLPTKIAGVFSSIVFITVLIQIGFYILKLLEHIVSRQVNEDLVSTVQKIIRVVIWAIVILLSLDNIPGVEIDTLVASLGVSGIVVGLAVQGILGDLFSSFLITLDKPVEEGDFVVLDDYWGTVEKVGWKSTRLRSFSGELIIVANTDMINSRIRNYQRMPSRRVPLNFGVIYQTTPEQIKKIPTIVKEIIESQEQTSFEHVHFTGFGDSSLDFQAGYYVNSPSWFLYLDIQEAVNQQLFERFAKEGIEFAYPTQTLFVENN